MNGNIAVMESRLETVETMVNELHAVAKGQTVVNTNLERTLALLQQSHFALVERYEKNTEPKVTELWENRSKLQGGYILLSILGGLIVGGASVAAVILKVLH